MQKSLKIIIFIFLCSQGVHAQGINITGKEVEACLRGGHNRSFNFFEDVSIIGSVEMNSRYSIKGGFSIGSLDSALAIKAFTLAQFVPFDKIDFLNFSLAYIYNGLPNYDAHSHTILPLVSIAAKRAGIAVGTSLRFTSFIGEDAVFESILSFSCYVNFINSEMLRIGISLSNFNNFAANNFGAFTFAVNSQLRLNEHWAIVNDLELMQSGIDGFSAAFYGFAWRGGAKFSW
jgi:hypothetical protein